MHVPSHADALLRKVAGPSGLLAGRYRPIEVLGQGGMGVVFKAVDERLQRDVAIKAIRADLTTPEFTSRFEAEANALARIHHPNVVQILDVAEPGSATSFYVMALVPGVSLSSLLREHGQLPWAESCDILTQVASALAAVHRAGVVHRDLKPSNVLCVKTGPGAWHAALIDFGIAIAPGQPRLTRPGEMLGTLPYMAPEQFTGAGIDRRTDVYGWGVLALELLGGVRPSELFGDTAKAGAPLRQRAPAVLERAGVRPALARIVERSLATQPEDRWPDMESVHSELASIDGERSLTLIYQRPVRLPKTGTVLPGDGRVAPARGGGGREVPVANAEPATVVSAVPPAFAPSPPRAPGRAPSRRWWWASIAALVVASLAGAAFIAGREPASPAAPITAPPIADASITPEAELAKVAVEHPIVAVPKPAASATTTTGPRASSTPATSVDTPAIAPPAAAITPPATTPTPVTKRGGPPSALPRRKPPRPSADATPTSSPPAVTPERPAEPGPVAGPRPPPSEDPRRPFVRNPFEN